MLHFDSGPFRNDKESFVISMGIAVMRALARLSYQSSLYELYIWSCCTARGTMGFSTRWDGAHECVQKRSLITVREHLHCFFMVISTDTPHPFARATIFTLGEAVNIICPSLFPHAIHRPSYADFLKIAFHSEESKIFVQFISVFLAGLIL